MILKRFIVKYSLWNYQSHSIVAYPNGE